MLGCDTEPGSRKLTVPSIDASAAGSADAYVPRTGWPAWAVLPAGVLIGLLSMAISIAASMAVVFLGNSTGTNVETALTSPLSLAVGLLAGQIPLILLTWGAAGLYSSNRSETLALRSPRGGWRLAFLALIPLFVITGAWTALLAWWKPEVVVGDLRLISDLIRQEPVLALLAIGIGAPLSEELMFRGFLFSGLAKSRMGLWGAALLTAALWTVIHGYSVFGLIEVFAIGLYFSWLLVRTGSLWVPMFCHAVYNTVIGLALYFVTLPPPA
jgi:membrane protease YdiL (CAAX protease family)